MDNLIFDRTLLDVETALASQNSTEVQKGAYNFNDLNRVETWVEYLSEKLKDYGFNQVLTIKKNWTMQDYPTKAQIDRIRGNIDALKEFCYAIQTSEIIYNNTLNYEQANILEKILFDINEYLTNITKQLNLDYKIAVNLVTKKYITLVPEKGEESGNTENPI